MLFVKISAERGNRTPNDSSQKLCVYLLFCNDLLVQVVTRYCLRHVEIDVSPSPRLLNKLKENSLVIC